MADATFDDLVEFAFEIADSVSETLPNTDYMSALCWSVAITNAALLSRAAQGEGKSISVTAGETAGMTLSTGFARALAEHIAEAKQAMLSDDEVSSLFGFYEAQLEAALLVADHQACRADPCDIGQLVEIMEQSGALELAETADDRVGLGMAADIAMGRLLWGRAGPPNHYGVVQRG